MTKNEIVEALKMQYQSFLDEIVVMTAAEFLSAPTGKWTAGQHLDHLCRSVWPLLPTLRLPLFVPKLLFGSANRPSKTYKELVAKYLKKIEGGAKASGTFIPKNIGFEQQKNLMAKLKKRVQTLCALVDKFTDPQLDAVILPHPLLGKVTLREMLYFTIHHAEHHKMLVLRNLE